MIIVGAGQAGLQVADSLRQEGFDGRILLFGEEAHGALQPAAAVQEVAARAARPISSIAIRGAEYLQRKQIELHTRMRVESIDCQARSVQLRTVSGSRIAGWRCAPARACGSWRCPAWSWAACWA